MSILPGSLPTPCDETRSAAAGLGDVSGSQGEPFQGRDPASEVNDGGCPEKPDHLKMSRAAYILLLKSLRSTAAQAI